MHPLPPALPQLVEDLSHRPHLVEHTGHLTGHQTAGGGIALKDGAPQTAQRVFFQLHLVGAGLFLPDILGQTLKLKKLTADQKFTQPPPLYTEATLIHALEENGIGRPSLLQPSLSYRP